MSSPLVAFSLATQFGSMYPNTHCPPSTRKPLQDAKSCLVVRRIRHLWEHSRLGQKEQLNYVTLFFYKISFTYLAETFNEGRAMLVAAATNSALAELDILYLYMGVSAKQNIICNDCIVK